MSNLDSRKLAREGFSQITETEGTRYFFQRGNGHAVRGLLRGRFMRPKPAGSRDPDQYFYEVRVTEPCGTVTRSEMMDNGETVLDEDAVADVGTIVRVDETQRLFQVISPLLAKGEPHEIIIECVGKTKIRGGKTFWRMNAYARVITEAERARIEGLGDADSADSGE